MIYVKHMLNHSVLSHEASQAQRFLPTGYMLYDTVNIRSVAYQNLHNGDIKLMLVLLLILIFV
jgi:hypothetical protein